MLARYGLTHILIVISLVASFLAQGSTLAINAGTKPVRQIPTAQQVVERFIRAVGGRAAWMKIKSQWSTGTIEVLPLDSKGTYEVYAKAPNRGLVVMKFARGSEIRTGFDGEKSWIQTLPNSGQYDPPEKQAANKRDSDFHKYLHFKQHFPRAKVKGIEDVGGAKAYLVEATPAGESLPERLYFDVRTGLLVLRDTSRKDAEGKKIMDLLYYNKYRQIDGIKVAFSLRIVQGDMTITTEHIEVKNNVAMDDAMFRLP